MTEMTRRRAVRTFGAAALVGSIGVGTASGHGDVATVTFEDQDANGVTVNVAETYLPDGGFVAIHDTRLFEGKPLESVVGHTAYKQPGHHTDVRVSVDVRPNSGEQTLIAMPHRNTNASRKYDFVTSGGEEDGPYFVDNDPEAGAVVDPGSVTF